MDADDFECSICLGKKVLNPRESHLTIITLETFEPPIKITQCGHMYCEKCLLGSTKGEQRWHCPDCRKLHECDINSLARNYHLEKLVEKFKKEKPKKSKNPYGICTKHNRAIEYRK